MCGRSSSSRGPASLLRATGVSRVANAHRYRQSYNVGPSTSIPIIRRLRGGGSGNGENEPKETQIDTFIEEKKTESEAPSPSSLASSSPSPSSVPSSSPSPSPSPSPPHSPLLSSPLLPSLTLDFAHWGLIPFYTAPSDVKITAGRQINARSETVNGNSFKRLINSHRCVAVFDGFYEWQTVSNGMGGKKKGSESKQGTFICPVNTSPILSISSYKETEKEREKIRAREKEQWEANRAKGMTNAMVSPKKCHSPQKTSSSSSSFPHSPSSSSSSSSSDPHDAHDDRDHDDSSHSSSSSFTSPMGVMGPLFTDPNGHPPSYDSPDNNNNFPSPFDSSPLLYLAALYDTWYDKAAYDSAIVQYKSDHPDCEDKDLPLPRITTSVTILTRDPPQSMKWIHERFPVVLANEKMVNMWLDMDKYSFEALANEVIHVDYDNSSHNTPHNLHTYPVSPYVNSIKNKGIQCIQRKNEYDKESKANGIGKFFGLGGGGGGASGSGIGNIKKEKENEIPKIKPETSVHLSPLSVIPLPSSSCPSLPPTSERLKRERSKDNSQSHGNQSEKAEDEKENGNVSVGVSAKKSKSNGQHETISIE